MQPQIFKAVEFPSPADASPPYLPGGTAENLWGREPVPVPMGHSRTVFISNYSQASDEEHPSLPPPGAVPGYLGGAGLPACLLLWHTALCSACAGCFLLARPGWPPLHPRQVCSLCQHPSRALQQAHRQNQAALPIKSSFHTEVRKTWASQGHICHRTPDTASALSFR